MSFLNILGVIVINIAILSLLGSNTTIERFVSASELQDQDSSENTIAQLKELKEPTHNSLGSEDTGGSGDTEMKTGDDGIETESEDETNIRSMDEELNKEEQKQQTMDIISANGLIPVNDTTVLDDSSNGVEGGDGTNAREVTCVKNNQGQVFCYEVLKPDETCLKPINAEDLLFAVHLLKPVPPLQIKGSRNP